MAFGDSPQPMQMFQMAPMRGKPQGNQDMGMRLLQAALQQQGKDKAALAAQPQAGSTMPGGAMNITPPTLPGGGGIMGLLGGLKGLFGGGAGGVMPGPLDSTNALY